MGHTWKYRSERENWVMRREKMGNIWKNGSLGKMGQGWKSRSKWKKTLIFGKNRVLK